MPAKTTQFFMKHHAFIHLTIALVIILIFWLLPPLAPITPIGMRVLGVFLGTLYGWNTCGFLWPSLLGILAFVLSGYMTMPQALAAGFGSSTCILLLFAFLFLSIMNDSGASRFIALWIISRKCFAGKPWLLSWAFFAASYALCCVTTAVATIVLCWSILYTLCQSVGYQSGDRYPTAMVIGVVYACEIGSVALPWRANPLLLMGTFESISAIPTNYLYYIAITIPIALICITLYIVMCKFLFRIDASRLAQANTAAICTADELTLNKQQKLGLGFLGVMVLAMLLPSLLPAHSLVGTILTRLTPAGILMTFVLLLMLTHLEGKPFFDFKTAARRIQWETIFLCAATLPITSALTNESTGIQPALELLLHPLRSHTSPFVFTLLIFIIAIILTNFANNVITGIILIPVVYSFSVNMGLDASAIVILMCVCVHFGILTPVASPMAAVLYSNTQWVKTKDILHFGFPALLLALTAIWLIGLPWTHFIGRFF